MKRIFFLLLFIPCLLRANSDALFSDDEDLTLFHHVNVITGNLNLYFQDAVVEGAEKLPLVRTYSSSGALERSPENNDLALKRLRDNWLIQGGWNLLPHMNLFVESSEKEQDFKVFLPEKNGSTISYVFAHREKNGNFVLRPNIKAGQCSGILSARTNPRNNILQFEPLAKKATLYLPDGGTREYLPPLGLSQDVSVYYLRLVAETSPSQHRTEYTYNGLSELKVVSLKNPKGTKTFASMLFDIVRHGEGSRYFRFIVETSDAKYLDYRSVNCKERNYLNDVKSSCRPIESAKFIPGRKGIGFRMQSLYLGGNQQFVAHYYEPENKKQAKKWAENPQKKGLAIDKVRLLEAPIGPNGQLQPIASFAYYSTHTDVRDVDNVLTRYLHDTNRLLAIEYYDAKDQLSSTLQFIWEGERLKAKAIVGKQTGTHFSKTFQYDSTGNVIEETFWGNLTGNASRLFSLQPDGSLSGAESYRKRYAYLPGFNVPILEEEEEGPIYRYSYLPNSNLLTAKFICDKDKILIRHFFFYDEDHLLVTEISDDGSFDHPDDLRDVTERSCKRYSRDYSSGLTTALTETYLDKHSGQEKLLKKTQYTHATHKKVVTEAVYDAGGVYRYTIHSDYDAQGRIVRKTTPNSQQSTYLYDTLGNLIESKEVGAPKKRYTYNLLGQPVTCEEIYSDGTQKISRSKYDPKGRLLSQTDKNGKTTSQSYDVFGNCLLTEFPKIKDQNGNPYHPQIRFTYDAQGNLTSATSSRNETTQTSYNTLKKPICITQADGSQIFNTYNKNGTLAKTTYPDQTTVAYTYDILQRMTSKTTLSANGDVLDLQTWEYNAFHLIAQTDSRGLVTTYEYDGAGRLVLERSEERKKAYVYDALGFLEKTTDDNLSHVTIRDEGGRVLEEWIEDQSGECENRMQFLYDDENRKSQAVRITSQGPAIDLFFYDGEGRLCKHIDPLGEITQFLHSEVQNDLGQYVLQKTAIDPIGHATIETFDALDHLVLKEKRSPQGKTVAKESFFYDAAGNRAKSVSTIFDKERPLKEITTVWEYDCFGNVVKEIEADLKTTLYTYDSRGRLRTKILPSQIRFDYDYDGLGRLINMQSSERSVHYQYYYEKGPDPTQIDDLCQSTTLQRAYNAFGQIIEEVNPCGLRYQWQYDNYGRCTLFTLPDHSSIAYLYKDGHLRIVRRQSAQGRNLYEHRYTQFDPNGHVQKEELINNLGVVTTTHDLLERPTCQETSWLQHSVSFGPSGLVMATGNTLLTSKTYAYDALNQLIVENDQSYSFDSIGNPTQYQVNDCNQILSTPECNLSYDPDGNPIERVGADASTSYLYDALGRLTEIRQSGKAVHYSYDAFSRLLSKEVIQEWWWWPTTQIEKSFYLYDQEKEIGTLSNNEIRELKILGLGVKGDIGAAIAIEIDYQTFAPLHDFNGHIIAIVSTNGAIFEKYQLDAFGKETTNSSSKNPWRFCSKRSEEGFVYFGKRFYDPALGRWLTPDPAGFVDGPNLYLYVLNSPLNRLDLFGLRADPVYPWTNNQIEVNIEVQIAQIPTSNIKDVLVCKGTIGNVEVDCVVSCGNWHKLQFSSEELQAGKINILDHFHEIMPKEGMTIGIITGQNGIMTSLNEFKEMSESIMAKVHESTLYVGLHNPTQGLAKDASRAFKELIGIETPTVCRTRQFMTAIVDTVHNINPNLLWMHITHSEGGLIAHRAIQGMNPDRKQQLREHLLSFSFGAAHPIPRNAAKSALNVYSNNDYLTYPLSKPFHNDSDYDIRIVNCLSSSDEKNFKLVDHKFMGTTGQQALDDRIERSRRDHGFYNENNR